MFREDKHLLQDARVLVLGASGFIGRWASRALCRQGAKLYLVVRDRASAAQVFSRYGISGEVIAVDLEQIDMAAGIIGKIAPDVTFNLAGYGVDRSERDEKTAYLINAHLVKVICEILAKTRNPNWAGQDIVHAGSALEYGEIAGNLSEDSVVNPTTLYGKSKLQGTNLMSQCCREYQVKGITARLFTVYGPGEHPGRLLPSLLETARKGASLPLTSGTQKRDFTYVEDVAEGLLRLSVAQAKPGQVVNLATGRLTSVRSFSETAARILRISASKLQFGTIPTRVEEMQHDEVNIDRLRQLTAWAPHTSIAEGIHLAKDFEQFCAEAID